MKNLTVFLIVGALAVLLVSGTLSVQLHPGNLVNILNWGTGFIGGNSSLDEYRNRVLEVKRGGELKVFTDINRRMDLSLGYAQTDVDHLKELVQKKAGNEQLISQSAQVLKSLHRIEGYAKELKVERLADIRPKLKELFASSEDLFADIHQNHTEITYIIDEFKGIIKNMEQYIGSINADIEPIPEEQSETTPTATPGLSIPLKF